MAADALLIETAREDLCRFLSACYYEPSADFIEACLFESMKAACEVLDPELFACAERLAKSFVADELKTLLVDHTRLFVGPSRPLAIPYGSFWLTGDASLMQEATHALQEIYQEGGFDVDEDFGDLPDHVAVELEFLYVLTFTRNRALRAGHSNELAGINEIRQRFLHEHLGKWVVPFSNAVQENAETSFYRELAELTTRFVLGEARKTVSP